MKGRWRGCGWSIRGWVRQNERGGSDEGMVQFPNALHSCEVMRCHWMAEFSSLQTHIKFLQWYLAKTKISISSASSFIVVFRCSRTLTGCAGFPLLQGYGFPVSQLFDMLLEMREQYGEILLKRWNITFRYRLMREDQPLLFVWQKLEVAGRAVLCAC